MRFYLDEDLSPSVAEIARGRCGLDVVSARDVGTREWSDEGQLWFAGENGRCLVTRNRNDFIEATRRAFGNGSPQGGVLILTSALPNHRFAAIAAALCSIAKSRPSGLQPYEIQFLQPT